MKSLGRPDRPLNVLFVFADQMRGFDMNWAGNPDIITPNLDRIAAEGVVFPTTFANAPVCTPSRGTILTGQYPIEHGAVANDIALGEAPTIADRLAHHGYRTGYIGKWHLDGVPRSKFTPPGPRRHGFEYWAAYNCSHDYFRPDKYYRDEGQPVIVEGYEPEIQTSLACDFLKSHTDVPFALYLSWGPPHDPYQSVPDNYRRLYEGRRLRPRPNVRFPGHSRLGTNLDFAETLASYYAAITALDAQLGRILDALDEAGLAEFTVLVFTSDHGDMLWSHGMLKKQQPMEESVRIPFVVRCPGQLPAGAVVPELASTIDFVPSILGLLGLHGEITDMPGADLLSSLAGRGVRESPDAVLLMDLVTVDEGLHQQIPEWRAVRTREHLYAESSGGEPWLLYDMIADPYQTANLIASPGSAARRTELAELLHTRLHSIGDRFESGAALIDRLGLGQAWEDRQTLRFADPSSKVEDGTRP